LPTNTCGNMQLRVPGTAVSLMDKGDSGHLSMYVYIIFGKDFPANPAWSMQHGTLGFLMDKGGLGNISTYILSLVRTYLLILVAICS
jgi:hypothetical protein